MRPLRPALFALVAFLSSTVAYAETAAEPTVALVEKFHDTLLGAMKSGEGIEARYKKLEPAIDVAFDLATMTKFTVGPTWSKMSAEEQAGLVKAFRRMTVASYARNFDAFKGQQFVTDAKVEVRGPDRLVKAQVIPAGEKPVNLTYRMRETAGAWKVIDVIYEYVSQLATRRADFASTVATGGAPALIKKLDEISDNLMKGKG